MTEEQQQLHAALKDAVRTGDAERKRLEKANLAQVLQERVRDFISRELPEQCKKQRTFGRDMFSVLTWGGAKPEPWSLDNKRLAPLLLPILRGIPGVRAWIEESGSSYAGWNWCKRYELHVDISEFIAE